MGFPTYQDVPLGVEARGSIAKTKTYRVRHGNGAYGTILGKKYQDEMIYYTPTNPQTVDQQANRTKFADAMASAIALTEEQRAPYKERAREEGGVTWFNIFIGDYMLA